RLTVQPIGRAAVHDARFRRSRCRGFGVHDAAVSAFAIPRITQKKKQYDGLGLKSHFEEVRPDETPSGTPTDTSDPGAEPDE
ncbi:MAG: hypothetical protein ABI591_19250, partial [Kofleriaceae bacterium]